MSRVVFTFGRFNPPTIGHQKLIEAVAKQASRDDYMIFTSHSYDKKKNPLKSDTKVEWMKLMFPTHAGKIQYDTSIKTDSFDEKKIWKPELYVENGIKDVREEISYHLMHTFQDDEKRYNVCEMRKVIKTFKF